MSILNNRVLSLQCLMPRLIKANQRSKNIQKLSNKNKKTILQTSNSEQQNTAQTHAQTNTPTPSAINSPTTGPNAGNQPPEANKTNQAKPQPKDSANKTPTCKDCSYNTCKAFSESDIKSILTSNRSNGAFVLQSKTSKQFNKLVLPL